jgi:hypothetical protein
MSTTLDDALLQFTWTPQPAAAAVIRELTDTFCTTNTRAQALATKMRDQTGTRFIDWVDHIVVPDQQADIPRWTDAGFEQTWIDGEPCYVHNGGIFPTLRTTSDTTATQLAICVDSVADFAAIHELDNIEGSPLARYRRALIAREGDTEFYVVERHGYTGFRITATVPEVVVLLSKHRDVFRTRLRALGNDAAGFAHVERLVTNAIDEIGQERTCDLFFAAEREYWQRRNRAARVQYARQAALGLGWGNDDHHTYRSSRRHFKRLIALFETLGFFCRERFYAGPEAGWGAQVLEHPTTGIVIFADVDMSPGELRGDFSHEGLTIRDQLGTIGLWCALHGESILEAGMHHLECTFDHALLREQLTTEHVETMDPFTSFPYLQQAFTRGEIWPVREARIDTLLAAGQITDEQAERFRAHGTLGSHLENLERNDGFKGFNQAGVNEIITNTDPRRHLIHAGA